MNRKGHWCHRINVQTDGLDAKCPRCGESFPVGPIFDHDPRVCMHCSANLVEWNLQGIVMIVDTDNAPPLVKKMIVHLSTLTEPEAQDQLEALLRAAGAII